MICTFKVINYCLQVYLKTLAKSVLKYMNSILLDPFLLALGLTWQACLKKTEVELELLTDIDILLIIEKGIRDRICHAIHKYAKANNKHIKNYDKNIISSYLMYLDANSFHGWGMSQNYLPTVLNG